MRKEPLDCCEDSVGLSGRAVMRTLLLALIGTIGAIAFAQGPFSPARYRGGPVPPIPGDVVGGGEVRVEAEVDRDGRVTAVRLLRTTPPFGDLVAGAVR